MKVGEILKEEVKDIQGLQLPYTKTTWRLSTKHVFFFTHIHDDIITPFG